MFIVKDASATDALARAHGAVQSSRGPAFDWPGGFEPMRTGNIAVAIRTLTRTSKNIGPTTANGSHPMDFN